MPRCELIASSPPGPVDTVVVPIMPRLSVIIAKYNVMYQEVKMSSSLDFDERVFSSCFQSADTYSRQMILGE